MQRSNTTKEGKTVYLWYVPVTFTSDFKTAAITWLADNQTAKNISINVSSNQWIIFNVNHDGKIFLITQLV